MRSASGSEVPRDLAFGTHLSPLDGVCLMEAVSVAAGQRWTDAPDCTHPLLSHLARLVNDASSPEARRQLVDYVPALVGASSDDPAVYPRLAAACIEYAMRYHSTVWMATLRGVCERQLCRESRPGSAASRFGRAVACTRRTAFEHGAAPRSVEAVVLALSRQHLESKRDAALRELLEIGLAAVTVDVSLAQPRSVTAEVVGVSATFDPAAR
jgi:hypothetical protein